MTISSRTDAAPSGSLAPLPLDEVALVGGTGYVAGEVLRLLPGHPRFRLGLVVTTSQPGAPVAAAFPHLAGALPPGMAFADWAALEARVATGRPLAVLLATPHGATAALADRLLNAAEAAGTPISLVDLSADFRFADAAAYQAVYGHPHGAPGRLPAFASGLPELLPGLPARHIGAPGCFPTAVTLGAAPFVAAGLVEPLIVASAVTGSSGSGRSPGAGTHHPARRSNLVAYQPLAHRHEAEMRAMLGRVAPAGPAPEVAFVPHSGPFVRGIHATLHLTLKPGVAPDAEALAAAARAFYGDAPFVEVGTRPPALTEVVGTNRCCVGVAARGSSLVVLSALDNLVKGAAGQGVQWLNRLAGLPDDTGLRLPGLGWM